MKEMTIDIPSSELKTLLKEAQSDRVLITVKGKPVAVLWGVQNRDAEDAYYETSPEFWKMIEERRKEPTVPLSRVKARLLSREKRAAKTERKRAR